MANVDIRDVPYLISSLKIPQIQSVQAWNVDYIPDNLFLDINTRVIKTDSMYYSYEISNERISILARILVPKQAKISVHFGYKSTGKVMVLVLFLGQNSISMVDFSTISKDIFSTLSEYYKGYEIPKKTFYYDSSNLLDLEFISTRLDRLQNKYLKARIHQIDEQLVIYPPDVEVDYTSNIILFYMLYSLVVTDLLDKYSLNQYKVVFCEPFSSIGSTSSMQDSLPMDNMLEHNVSTSIIKTKSHTFLLLSPVYLMNIEDTIYRLFKEGR